MGGGGVDQRVGGGCGRRGGRMGIKSEGRQGIVVLAQSTEKMKRRGGRRKE